MTKVVVLGASGMLGSMVVDVLASEERLEVRGTVRSEDLRAVCCARIPQADWTLFDAGSGDDAGLAHAVEAADWVVNAIGLTKPYIHDDDAAQVEAAIMINAAFPYRLAREAARSGARVVQIATDCVYSGMAGRYRESATHDALDAYGKTKSLGEANLPNVHLLRSSIIGPEPKTYAFLLEWLRRQPAGATVNGYLDHLWNGVTTLAFARICCAVVRGAVTLSSVQHVVPAGDVTKAELLKDIARAYGRGDIHIEPVQAPSSIDRTLRTEHSQELADLWAAAGYSATPSVAEMVAEVASYPFRLEGLSP